MVTIVALLGTAVQSASAMPADAELARPADAGPLAGKTIVIDPGHQLGNSRHLAQIDRLVNGGGFMKACNTTGTSTNGGFPESTFAWEVATLLRARLVAEGAKVYLTRYSNSWSRWGPCVNVRGRLGNRVHADAAISIHGDGAASQYHGFFVIMPGHRAGWADDIYVSSRQMGAAVHGGLVDLGVTIANDYGGKGYSTRTDLGTLNWSNVPIVMVELGNMRNATDAGHMTSPAYRNYRYSRGLAVGVTRYVTHH
jgi:N-acetylmuramoyl-L-alanine amidase